LLTGDSADNYLAGAKGNDLIDGKDGNDALLGSSTKTRGELELDILTGGTGSDKLILGDSISAYYKTNGDRDLAKITDFGSGDLIQLGLNDTYRISRTDVGFDLFVTTGETQDLIANVQIASSSGSESDLLAGVPEGSFTIGSEEISSLFIGA
jgi:Ca2+-binding RTX toxin-like protein